MITTTLLTLASKKEIKMSFEDFNRQLAQRSKIKQPPALYDIELRSLKSPHFAGLYSIEVWRSMIHHPSPKQMMFRYSGTNDGMIIQLALVYNFYLQDEHCRKITLPAKKEIPR